MTDEASRWRSWALIYLGLTLVWSWPLPIHLTDRFAHDPGDPLLVTYLLWWQAHAHAMPFTTAWWRAPFFWPFPDALALTDHVLGLSLVSTPIQLVGGSPLLAYNVLLICSTWWTLLAMHALTMRLTRNAAAAACAAIAFAFSPYRTSELAHLQLYACWWVPIALLAVHAYVKDGKTRWLAVFAAAWLLQALTSGYHLFFLPLLLAAWTIWITPWRTHARRARHVALVFAAVSTALIPSLLHYYHVQTWLGVARPRDEMVLYSAGWRSLLATDPNLLFWHLLAPRTTESYLFPGVTVTALVIAAMVVRVRDRMLWFWAATAACAFWLCFGPSPETSIASLWHPYDWLLVLPGFSGVRVPSRFFAFSALGLAIAAGMALGHLRTRVRRPALLTALVFVGLFVDGSIRGMPLGIPPGGLAVRANHARLLSLPFDDAMSTVSLMYESMSMHVPVVNGYAGYVPPHAAVLNWALRRHDPTVVTELRRGAPLFIIVAPGDEADDWSRFAESQPGSEMLGVTGGGRVYEVPAAPYADDPLPGPPLAIARRTMSDPWLIADLGAPQVVRFVEIRTMGIMVRLPVSLTIEASLDGRAWNVISDERPGGAALRGALRDPRTIPVRVLVPDVNARYIRVNAASFHPEQLFLYGP